MIKATIRPYQREDLGRVLHLWELVGAEGPAEPPALTLDQTVDLTQAEDAIALLREAQQHLLVCATNAVGRLDPAFLRPGRFDYVLPVGPPDPAAREAIWRRYVDEITDEPVDVRRARRGERDVHPGRRRVRGPKGSAPYR